MVTRTDADAMRILEEKYNPKVPGIADKQETRLITDALEIKSRSNIELQNIRDFAVLYYAVRTASGKDPKYIASQMDRLSGVTAIIDSEKAARGLPV